MEPIADRVVTAERDTEIDPRRWWTLLVLCLSLFMVVMGNTVLNVALPSISESLGASGTQLQWMVDAYSLVFAGLLFTSGSLGDRFGRKGALNTGLVIFAAGSITATFAHSAAVVIGARAVMGVGASLVMPATLSVLTHVFPAEERAKAIGIWAGIAGAAGAIGPVAAGWLLDHFYWGSVFWLNVPVVAAALIGGYFLVPTSRHPDRVPLDPLGALLSIGTISTLVYAVIEGRNYGWSDPLILGAFAASAVLLVAFITWQLKATHPMLDVRLFRDRGFTGGSLAISMVFFGMFGVFFLLFQYLQMARGYSTLEAGIRTLPFSAVMMIAAPSSAALSARFGTRAVVAAGLATTGTGLLLLGQSSGIDSSYGVLALSFCVLALGMGLTMAPSTASIMAALPHAKAGVGSAMNDTTRELGGALGIAVLGTLFGSAYAHSIRDTAAGLPPDIGGPVKSSLGEALQVVNRLGPRAPEVLDAAREAFMDGFARALTAGAIMAYAGAGVALLVLPKRATVAATDELEPDIEAELA